QERSELVAERPRDAAERSDEIATVLQSAVVGDSPRRLERQLVRRRRLRGPAANQLLVGHPIERVVDLDRGEARRVIRQHLRCGKVRWIKAALPFGIVVAGRSDPDHGGAPTVDYI